MPCDDPAMVSEQYARRGQSSGAPEPVRGGLGPACARRPLADAHRMAAEIACSRSEAAPASSRSGCSEELDADVSFVDISPRMVELARARGIDAQVADVQELPFADGAFDTVVAAWMLYHVPDVGRGLAEIARVLRPGGALVAVTNSIGHLERAARADRLPDRLGGDVQPGERRGAPGAAFRPRRPVRHGKRRHGA